MTISRIILRPSPVPEYVSTSSLLTDVADVVVTNASNNVSFTRGSIPVPLSENSTYTILPHSPQSICIMPFVTWAFFIAFLAFVYRLNKIDAHSDGCIGTVHKSASKTESVSKLVVSVILAFDLLSLITSSNETMRSFISIGSISRCALREIDLSKYAV